MSDAYRTLREPARIAFKRKGSRFIAEAFPASTAETAETHIATVQAREHQATHHCTAYRIGPDGHTFRYNDDGEPSGTAGPPILQQIDGHDLTNTLVVVTRYYGGTKLGTGGLVRAYGDAAADVLDAASIITRIVRVPVHLTFSYEDTAPAKQALQSFDIARIDEQYTDVTKWVIGIRPSDVDAFVDTFTNALGGRATIHVQPNSSNST